MLQYKSSAPTLAADAKTNQLCDASGNLKVAIAASTAAAGTEYTEDAAAAANPVGPVILAVRRDTLATNEVTTDGDNIALKATSKGELHSRNLSLEAVLPVSLGGKAAGASLSVAPAGMEYEAVAASQTDQVLGATGALGDYLDSIIIQPAAVTAGTVTLKDDTTVILTFTTGTLASLSPIVIPLGIFSVAGAFKITTGLSVAVLGIGNFT